MITLTETTITRLASEGRKVVSDSDLISLVDETKESAKLNGTSVSMMLYLTQVKQNTISALVLNCMVAEHMGISFKIEGYPHI